MILGGDRATAARTLAHHYWTSPAPGHSPATNAAIDAAADQGSVRQLEAAGVFVGPGEADEESVRYEERVERAAARAWGAL